MKLERSSEAQRRWRASGDEREALLAFLERCRSGQITHPQLRLALALGLELAAALLQEPSREDPFASGLDAFPDRESEEGSELDEPGLSLLELRQSIDGRHEARSRHEELEVYWTYPEALHEALDYDEAVINWAYRLRREDQSFWVALILAATELVEEVWDKAVRGLSFEADREESPRHRPFNDFDPELAEEMAAEIESLEGMHIEGFSEVDEDDVESPDCGVFYYVGRHDEGEALLDVLAYAPRARFVSAVEQWLARPDADRALLVRESLRSYDELSAAIVARSMGPWYWSYQCARAAAWGCLEATGDGLRELGAYALLCGLRASEIQDLAGAEGFFARLKTKLRSWALEPEGPLSGAVELATPSPRAVRVGQRVIVCSGAMQDFEGEVVARDRDPRKLRVALMIFGRRTEVSLPVEDLRHAPPH